MSLAELEDSLLRNLFKGYQKWVRPVQHANDTITVRFGLKISQLVDVVSLALRYLYEKEDEGLNRKLEEKSIQLEG